MLAVKGYIDGNNVIAIDGDIHNFKGSELLIHIVDKPANKLASQKLSAVENERLNALKSITGVLKNCKPVTIEEIREERIRERYGL